MKRRRLLYVFIATTLLLCSCTQQDDRGRENTAVPESNIPSVGTETTNAAETTTPSGSDETKHTAESTAPSGSDETKHAAESTAPSAGTETAQNPADATDTITEEEAKQIALDQVPGATASDILSFKSDYENGRLQYEGKIHFDKNEYEFEIDAYTGNITEWDIDPINDVR